MAKWYAGRRNCDRSKAIGDGRARRNGGSNHQRIRSMVVDASILEVGVDSIDDAGQLAGDARGHAFLAETLPVTGDGVEGFVVAGAQFDADDADGLLLVNGLHGELLGWLRTGVNLRAAI